MKHRRTIVIAGKRLDKTFDTAEVADEWLTKQREIRAQIKLGKKPLKPISVEGFAQIFLKEREGKSSFYHYEGRVKRYITGNPALAKKLLFQTTVDDWSGLFGLQGDIMVKHGLSPATHNCIRTTFSAMYQRAIKLGYAKTNPILETEILKAPQRARDFLKEEEDILRYIDAGYRDEIQPAFGILATILVNTGQRIGNVVGLKWEDLDLDGRVMTIRRKRLWERGEGEKFALGLKSHDEEEHVVGISEALCGELLAWRSVTPWNRPEDWVVARQDGHFFTSKVIRTGHRRLLKRAGLKSLVVHGLRHTYAIHYLQNGGSMVDLKYTLKHSSISTTQIYGRSNPATLVARANIFQIGRAKSRVPEAAPLA